ncbi:hypothetical protein ACSFB2_12625, partial [Glaesserella parasuis]
MKLIFDSATEYFDFLDMQMQAFGGVRQVQGPNAELPTNVVSKLAVEIDASEFAANVRKELGIDQPGDIDNIQTPPGDTPETTVLTADKPRRTRKPKAPDAAMAEQPGNKWPDSPTLGEMQAEAAAQGLNVSEGSTGEQMVQAAHTLLTQAAQDARAVHAQFAADAVKHAGQIDPAKLAERVAALGVVDPAKHLTAARMFIARHQLPAYHQVQRDAGLPDDIISYTD